MHTLLFIFHSGAATTFSDSFINAVKQQEGDRIIKCCGDAVVEGAVFTAVKNSQRGKSMEFLQVSLPVMQLRHGSSHLFHVYRENMVHLGRNIMTNSV